MNQQTTEKFLKRTMSYRERGTSADPKATQPDSFVPLRETTKISIVDDDVLPGVRYFYHVRAFNNKGYGPWSNVVSKVQ
ncbi:MAG: fibronectin type III domain-containing protein [Ignavibacteriae bacterium]|nr:fibronectin type III domain-containing protein [Ignavibacteriota bacterium]